MSIPSRKIPMVTYYSLLFALIAILTISAAESNRVSGFLGDYSQLEHHPDPDRNAMVYTKPGLDLKEYKGIYVAFPLVQLTSDQRQSTVDPRDLTELAQYFYDKIIGALEDEYPLADEPGPGVVVVRTAIVDVNPINRVAGVAGKLALKVVNLDVGGASIEAEMVDGDTGERLAALLESKKADRVEVGIAGAKQWGHAKAAFKAWAELLEKRVGELGLPKLAPVEQGKN